MQNIRQLHRGENTMREKHTEAQGKTTNPMDNQQETKEEITKSNDWCSVRTELPAHKRVRYCV